MTDKNRLYTGAAIGLIVAAGIGFGAARLTQSPAPAPAAPAGQPSTPDKAAVALSMTAQSIAASEIAVAPAASGELDAAILASATVAATPDAEAVLTARAPGTVTRIFLRIGDPVRAGQTLALVESRDASQIAADRASASARANLAAKQLARERSLLDQGVSPRADLEMAQANLAVAQADARRASAAAGAARVTSDGRSVAIVSPVSGRVTSAVANLGQFVAAETELFRVADPRRLQIIANVPPADASRVRDGDRVELTTSDGRTMEGRVRSATGVVDPQSRTGTVVITPDAGASMLAPGQLVTARILASGGATKSGVLVPQDAVQTLGDQTVVFVRTPQGFKARPIRIGSRSGGMVAIADGLAAGTQIATTNAFLIKAEFEKESAE
ncbi:efflux RND transporter periplasmic adaptor subunit [Sphingobium yanoikuyae]|uniref:Efflux RND transporter periplasmic adaptor subunit n=1 Tax=Sphingobium yanoikuyae TaxID=13690 RepID=A0A6P1GMC3_SPHYA|nr:efflux RND transporter periplasmic adaptor subunit [Sphingobium yanoikuyae]QHD69588.1 efflux RND transporter periplasmic adaptor subunit [Sphingobium yanoikuyae]